MVTRFIILLIGVSLQVHSQTDLGIGFVSIDLDDKTVLEFFPDTPATSPVNVISFFDGPTINS